MSLGEFGPIIGIGLMIIIGIVGFRDTTHKDNRKDGGNSNSSSSSNSTPSTPTPTPPPTNTENK